MKGFVNFHYAISLAQQLYDVEGDTEDLEEVGLVAFDMIGNKRTRLYRATLEVGDDGRVTLPCNCDLIEAVTYCGPEDWAYTSNIHEYGDIQSSFTENYIESRKAFLDPLYQSGKFVKYRHEGDYIYVNKGFGKINLLYHGEQLDEDGLPEITMKEAVAIADFIAYIELNKKAIRTNNRVAMEQASRANQQWLLHCDKARQPEFLSQNEMDMILDALSSWNRKKKGYSYKPTL